MGKKPEPVKMIHCDTVITLKDGKGTCPKCDKPLRGDIGAPPKKPDTKKRDAGRGRKPGDMWLELGYLFVTVPPALFVWGLWNNGIQSFNMALFTLVVILALGGYAMIAANRKKA